MHMPMEQLLPAILLAIGVIAASAILGPFILRAACWFHNYVGSRIIAEYEYDVQGSGRQYPPAQEWAAAPKDVEMPDYYQALLMEAVAGIVGAGCAFGAFAAGFSRSVAIGVEATGGFVVICVLFCAILSAALEKGLLIALLDRLIKVLVAAPIVAVVMFFWFR